MPDYMKSRTGKVAGTNQQFSTQNKLMRCIELQHDLTEALTVKFGAEIQPDGEIAWVTIEKFGQRINLTPKQAVSLAEQIRQRVGV